MTHLPFGPHNVGPTGLGGASAVSAEPSSNAGSERLAAPRHVSQLVRLVQNARRRGTPITVVGRGGVPLDGVMTVDLSSWHHVETPNVERLTVTAEPGATFRQIMAKTLPFGLVPKALPLDLDSSLGGALSGVRVGSASHKNGLLASQVAYAQVVLGTGEVVHTGPGTERDVFDCVLGGAGRFGVITSVELKLEAAPDESATYVLGYADCAGLVRDLMQLADDSRALYLLAKRNSACETQHQTPSDRPQYSLAVTLVAAPSAPGRPALPAGLGALSSEGPILHDWSGFCRLHQEFTSAAPARGTRWGALLPAAPALPLVLEHMLAVVESSHTCAVTVLTRGSDDPTLLALPGSRRVVAVSGHARRSSDVDRPSEGGEPRALAEMQQRVYRAGGRLCPSGWLARRDPGFWRAHYGARYTRVSLLKRLFDPADILKSTAGQLRPAH